MPLLDAVYCRLMASLFRSGRYDDRGIEIGVWRNNRAGVWFLDWFAEHRCVRGDELWAYCKDDAQRWPGRGVDLHALVPDGDVIELTDAELDAAYGNDPNNAQLLLELAAVTRGEWTGTVDSELPHGDERIAAQLAAIRARCIA